jgi:hypothetical protein
MGELSVGIMLSADIDEAESFWKGKFEEINAGNVGSWLCDVCTYRLVGIGVICCDEWTAGGVCISLTTND